MSSEGVCIGHDMQAMPRQGQGQGQVSEGQGASCAPGPDTRGRPAFNAAQEQARMRASAAMLAQQGQGR